MIPSEYQGESQNDIIQHMLCLTLIKSSQELLV